MVQFNPDFATLHGKRVLTSLQFNGNFAASGLNRAFRITKQLFAMRCFVKKRL